MDTALSKSAYDDTVTLYNHVRRYHDLLRKLCGCNNEGNDQSCMSKVPYSLGKTVGGKVKGEGRSAQGFESSQKPPKTSWNHTPREGIPDQSPRQRWGPNPNTTLMTQ